MIRKILKITSFTLALALAGLAQARTLYVPIVSASDYPYVCFNVRVINPMNGATLWGSEGRVDRIDYAVVPMNYNGPVNLYNFILPQHLHNGGYPGTQYLHASQFPIEVPFGYKLVYRFNYIKAAGLMGCLGSAPFVWEYLQSPAFFQE